MNRLHIDSASTVPESCWQPFPGGELEGTPATALCPTCRAAARECAGVAHDPVAPERKPALCFECYLRDIRKSRALTAAANLDTASDARFQSSLPFEPVDHARLTRLKAERAVARVSERKGIGAYIEKRRRAQIEARHALATIVQGLKQRRLTTIGNRSERVVPRTAAAVRLSSQLPESWLPFVVAR